MGMGITPPKKQEKAFKWLKTEEDVFLNLIRDFSKEQIAKALESCNVDLKILDHSPIEWRSPIKRKVGVRLIKLFPRTAEKYGYVVTYGHLNWELYKGSPSVVYQPTDDVSEND